MTALLRLFVAAMDGRARGAIRRIRVVGNEELGEFQLDIVDVRDDIEAATQAGVIATPTLILVHPGPERRIVGDLSNADALRAWLANIPDDEATLEVPQ